MPILRLFAGTVVISTPSMTILPDVGVSKPATMRSVVVLPQPLGPRNEMNSPLCAVRLNCSTAVNCANCLCTSVISRNAMCALS